MSDAKPVIRDVLACYGTWIQKWIQMKTACCNLLFIDVLERQVLRTLSLRRIGLPREC